MPSVQIPRSYSTILLPFLPTDWKVALAPCCSTAAFKAVITALPLCYRYRYDRHYRYRLDERGGNYRHNGKINANNGNIFPNLEANRGNE